ncbi:TraN (plasmid) [Escherichia coli]|nr:TraN [Escherichia coli]
MLGVCLEKKRSYCQFDSKLAQIRGFFPDVLCLSSYCAGRSGCVTGMMLALILLINKQHNTGYL